MELKLYKVTGPDGEAIHGGKLLWSLPRNGQPGNWHEVPIVTMCERGFHLTSEKHLAEWMKDMPGARVFEADADGVVGNANRDNKVAAKRCRLVREVSNREIRSLLFGDLNPIVCMGEIPTFIGSGDGYGYGYGSGDGYGYGYGYGYGSGYGDGSGHGSGDGYGYGYGSGYGDGYGYGYGYGDGSGYGYGDGSG